MPYPRQVQREMIIPNSIRSLFRKAYAWAKDWGTQRSSGSTAGGLGANARQWENRDVIYIGSGGRGANARRENRDVIYIGGSDPRQWARQSMRDWRGRPTTNCPERERIERQFKAMEDLQDVTFVVTNENLEWVVDDERDDNSSSAADDEGCMPAKPQCHLVLPDAGICKPCGSISTNDSDRMCRRRANECTICFTEYDVGDVIVCSKHCRHVFHQECMLEWLSRGNHNCPTCRSTFYVPTDIKEESFDEGEMSMQERQRLAFRRVDLIQEVTDH
mmetsp:Transcript_33144/g.79164  ORF Transcript_33144/g.79164 Transcript_33144/m.79164 type:complete len:275 (-) Transcript_33144:105-929(-)